MEKLIEFKEVKKEYKIGEVIINALDGVDFSISKGEFVVILGASGAGKSTILNILGGMDTATSGQVFVGDQEITKYNEKKLTKYRGDKVGFVFQFYKLIPNLNVLENVEFANEVSKNHLDAKDILHKVGLTNRIKNFPSQLSGENNKELLLLELLQKILYFYSVMNQPGPWITLLESQF